MNRAGPFPTAFPVYSGGCRVRLLAVLSLWILSLHMRVPNTPISLPSTPSLLPPNTSLQIVLGILPVSCNKIAENWNPLGPPQAMSSARPPELLCNKSAELIKLGQQEALGSRSRSQLPVPVMYLGVPLPPGRSRLPHYSTLCFEIVV